MYKAWIRQGRRRPWSLGLAVAIQSLFCALPQVTEAAERIVVSYGMLERSIQVDDLQTFVDTGALSPQLREYARILRLSPEDLTTFGEILTTPVDLSEVAVAQFLYTSQGKLLLKQVASVVQTPSRRAGLSATRGALILAAADDDSGLTILNFLKKFPSDFIRIDVGRGLALARSVNQVILQSEQAIDLIKAEAAATAAANPLSEAAYNQAIDRLESARSYQVIARDFQVENLSAPVRLYLPQNPVVEVLPPRNVPLIVISHGLGSNRITYQYLAEYLAAAGFAVAAIEHTGSNDQQLLNLQEGLVDDIVADGEFSRRPTEISKTLDAIATASRTGALRGLINLRQIGLIGQSFGGYTALATAGATFSPETYGQFCPPEPPVLNLSLLLQCQALVAQTSVESPIDPRIDAVFVMNPVGSALFGPEGYGNITQPLMMVAGTADTIAPAFPEQIRPFTWLQGDDNYLLLLRGGTHFSVIGSSSTSIEPVPVPPEVIGPQPELAQTYMKVFALAFFQRYLNQEEQFQLLLSAAFAQRLSQEPIPLSLIQSLPPEQLNEALGSIETPSVLETTAITP